MNDIIPFGKYRGQEIEQIRQRDPAYLQWLVQQAWFSEKFAPTYQLVVNNFAPPSDETPAHNALQVRFLDFSFQVAFWYASGAEDEIDWVNLAKRFNNRIEACDLRKAPTPHKRSDRAQSPYGIEFEKRRLENHRNAVRERWATWRTRNKQPRRTRSFGPASFENISDVTFGVELSVGWDTSRATDAKAYADFDVSDKFRLYIEIKPSIGDDYPAVLRQIKRQQQKTEGSWHILWCLLVDQFASQAVTLDQVRKIFERDEIKVVMMQDVRDELIKRNPT